PAGAVAGAIAGSIAGEVAGGVSAVVSGATNNNGDYSLGGSALSGTVSAGLAGLTEGAMGAGAGIGSTGSLGAVGGGLNDVIGNPNSSLLSVTYSATIGGALGMIGGMEAGLTPLESGLLGAGTTLICEDISAYPNAFSDECPYSILLDNVH
ncbi:MAG: hypothetical protein MUF13_14750, partial [Akkermansiaceae bacterium]|nr:hypothetical protein [Akkermansiaceae bacterium]